MPEKPPLPVLLGTFGSAGDVYPFISLGKALKQRGHRPIFVGNPYFLPAVERAGIESLPIGDAEAYLRSENDLRLWNPLTGLRVVMGEGVIPAMRPLYELIAAQPREGLVLAAGYLAFGARLAAEHLGLPLATVCLQPVTFASKHAPPRMAGLPDLGRLPRPVMSWLFDLIALRLTDPLIVGPLNALRAELGLGPVRDVLRTWAHSPDLCVCLFPEWFAAPQPDWPTCAVTTDFPLDDGGGEPSEELRAFVEAGPPPVVFTAGSAMHHAGRYFEHATQAARLLNRRVVLVAKAGAQMPARLPEGVHRTEYAPFSWLFARAAMVGHHGGIGTTAQCLRAGVPQLLTPFNFDQPDNAYILKRLGVAEVLAPGSFRADRAQAAIKRLLESPRVAEDCRNAAERCRRGGGPQQAVELLESLARGGQPG